MMQTSFSSAARMIGGFVKFSICTGAIASLFPAVFPAQAQSVCGNGTTRAAFDSPSYQLTVCQEDSALFLISQQKGEERQLLRMPAFYNPETQVFGGVRTIPAPGTAYSYDLSPAITTVYYLQDNRLFVLENGRLAVNEPITQTASR